MVFNFCSHSLWILCVLFFACVASDSDETENDLSECQDCDFRVLYHDLAEKQCFQQAQRYVKMIFLVNKKLNWFQANTFCRSHQMSLTTVHSLKKQLHLADKVKQHLCDNDTRVWMGLNNVENLIDPGQHKDNWRGVDAETLPKDDFDQYWDNSESPNPSRTLTERCIGLTFESCGELRVGNGKSHGKLNDNNCYAEQRFLCTKRYTL